MTTRRTVVKPVAPTTLPAEDDENDGATTIVIGGPGGLVIETEN